MLMGEEPSPAADIYSFGVVLWEICCQEMPQRGRRRDPTPAEAPMVPTCSRPSPSALSRLRLSSRRYCGSLPAMQQGTFSNIAFESLLPLACIGNDMLNLPSTGGGGNHPDVPAIQTRDAAERQGGAGDAGPGG